MPSIKRTHVDGDPTPTSGVRTGNMPLNLVWSCVAPSDRSCFKKSLSHLQHLPIARLCPAGWHLGSEAKKSQRSPQDHTTWRNGNHFPITFRFAKRGTASSNYSDTATNNLQILEALPRMQHSRPGQPGHTTSSLQNDLSQRHPSRPRDSIKLANSSCALATGFSNLVTKSSIIHHQSLPIIHH